MGFEIPDTLWGGTSKFLKLVRMGQALTTNSGTGFQPVEFDTGKMPVPLASVCQRILPHTA